jgi:cell envelope opacity-associated protein A
MEGSKMSDTAPAEHPPTDPTTWELMEGVRKANEAMQSPTHRKDLQEMAEISRKLIELGSRHAELQEAIGVRNEEYLKAEELLGRHLVAKRVASIPVTTQVVDEAPDDVAAIAEARAQRRQELLEHHAANCAVGFGDPCDCQ